MKISEGFPGRKVTYGVDAKAEYRAENIVENGLLGSTFRLAAEGSSRQIKLTLPGRHNLENLLAAIATARTIGISWSGIERGITQLQPAYHRGVAVPWKGATLYDDTYNSNPYALRRTLQLLAAAQAEGRRIAVVGDMLELGADELKFHHEAGRAIPRSIDYVVGVGKRSTSFLQGAQEAGVPVQATRHFENAAAAAEFLRTLIKPGDLVLLKGSRGIGLDKVITALEKET
jgi:UDP-N-acetylmuramoyl-tripeptide--D-alanyl-D-alanine ligase